MTAPAHPADHTCPTCGVSIDRRATACRKHRDATLFTSDTAKAAAEARWRRERMHMGIDITILEDNAGGLTLQITDTAGNRYQRTYASRHIHDTPTALAHDLQDAATFTEWEGNDLDDGIEWIDGDGYRALSLDQVRAIDPREEGGATMRELVLALRTSSK